MPTKFIELIFVIHQQGKVIQFVWVPAHRGVNSNEKAHKLAKEATKNEEVRLNIPLSCADVKVLVKCSVNKIWQADWDKKRKGRLVDNLQKEISSSNSSYANRQEVWFTQMRIGHSGLNSSHHTIPLVAYV